MAVRPREQKVAVFDFSAEIVLNTDAAKPVRAFDVDMNAIFVQGLCSRHVRRHRDRLA